MNPADILRQLQTLPKKHFGQHFLVDEQALSDILEAGALAQNDTVVEIGPGLGVLTRALAQRVNRVIAIEADPDLATYLREKLPKNVDLIAGDALRVDWEVTIEGDYKIVANIPYSITSPLLRKIFLLEKKPTKVVLLVQKELAERITALPGKSERGLLTVLTEASATARVIRTVKPGSFHPAPKVDSAILELTPSVHHRMDDIFWPAVEAGFRHKRQTLANSLKDLMIAKADSEAMLTKLGLDPMVRPQVLSFHDWKNLSKLLLRRQAKV